MLTLSEAIRLGSMLKPQAFGASSHAGSCALRAATEALGIKPVGGFGTINYIHLRRDYPFLNNNRLCPACGDVTHTIGVIWHLNDIHRWTREQIADWVQTIESKAIIDQPVPVAPVSVGGEG